jgi:hypothetical protein
MGFVKDATGIEEGIKYHHLDLGEETSFSFARLFRGRPGG